MSYKKYKGKFKGYLKSKKRKRTKYNSSKYRINQRYMPTTVGSKSTMMALGTCLPELVSEKKVLNESSPPPRVLSEGMVPSGWIPCSRQ